MSQQEIYIILKRGRKWMSCNDISKKVDVNIHTIRANLNKLYKSGYLLRKEHSVSKYKGRSLWRIK